MTLTIFGRFHAAPGNEAALEAAMRAVTPPSRAEEGCVSIAMYRSTEDPRLFFIHSVWADEAAFAYHRDLQHTIDFLATADPLLDEPRQLNRALAFA